MGTKDRLELMFKIDHLRKKILLAHKALLIRAHMVIIQVLQRKPRVIY